MFHQVSFCGVRLDNAVAFESNIFSTNKTSIVCLKAVCIRGDVKIHLPRPQCAAASRHWLLLVAKIIIFEID